MFTVLQYDKQLEKGSIDDLHFHKLKWIDLLHPTKDELSKLAEKANIPLEDLSIAADPNERPGIREFDHYQVFIIQAPHKTKSYIRTASFALLVSEKLIITIRKHDNFIADLLAQNNLADTFSKGSTNLAITIIREAINDYFGIFDTIEEKINSIEDKVFNNPQASTVQDIFKLKNTLVYFHRGLAGNRDVLLKIENTKKMKITAQQNKQFRYLYADVIQLLDVAATYRDILTGALDIYLGSVSNNLNVTMKKMTAWGSLVLIPTLIASVYGMNFRHMPELPWIWGYPFALALMIVSALVFYKIFTRKGYL